MRAKKFSYFFSLSFVSYVFALCVNSNNKWFNIALFCLRRHAVISSYILSF